DTIKIHGVERLTGGTYAIIPDQIEAGTYMAAVAAAGGQVLIKNIIPKHMECITAKLEEMGVSITEYDDSILVDASAPLKKTNIKTMPYPGFPTDMQPQMATVMLRAEGVSKINEGVWDSRFKYTEELIRMGAQISVAGKIATVEGGHSLLGAPVRACDLRAGAAMVIAGLMAKGTTTIEEIDHIRRGYERIVEKFAALGADIRLILD
ncbi:MAG: UDP-N-acetylglucosamine 1-carboxyvinyltransferase, partial [Clostridia bacterium]|nr:UDP-N-acetylglucosamine 1-carboxyvinyltransferase [Clostridia bacterium]